MYGGDGRGDVGDMAFVDVGRDVYLGFQPLLEEFQEGPGIGNGPMRSWSTWYKSLPLALFMNEDIENNDILGEFYGDDAALLDIIRDNYEFTLERITTANAVGSPRLSVYGLATRAFPGDDRIWYGIESNSENRGQWNRQPAKCNVYITYTGDGETHRPFYLFSFYYYVNYQISFDATWKLITYNRTADVTVTPYAWYLYPDATMIFDPEDTSDYEYSGWSDDQWFEKIAVSYIDAVDDEVFRITDDTSMNGYTFGYTYTLIAPATGTDNLGIHNGSYTVRINSDPSNGANIELVAPLYKERAAPAYDFMFTHDMVTLTDGDTKPLVRYHYYGADRNSYNIYKGGNSSFLWQNYNSPVRTY